MSEFRIDQIKSQDASRGPDIAGITTFTGTSGIVMPSGDTAYRGGRGRGVFGGGYSSAPNASQEVMDYVTIATLGNATDFGDLNPAILSFAKLIISSSDTLSPSFKTTTALTASPHLSSGIPITATSLIFS